MSIEKFLIAVFNILDSISGAFVTPYIMLIVLERFLPVRRKRWARPALYAGCLIFTEASIIVGDPVNITGAISVIFLTNFICCEGTYLQRFSVTLIFSSLGLSLNALIDNFLWLNLSLKLCFGSYMRWGFLHMLIWLIIYFALKRFAPKQEYYLPPKLWALVDLLTLAPFAAMLVTVILNDYICKSNDAIRDLLLLIVIFLTSYGLLWAVAVLAQNQNLEQEKSFYEMNRMYYRNLEQEQFQVRRLRHDMANHLQTMSALPELELRKYLNGLINSPAMEHTCAFCENSVVNIVLASKKAVMEQNKISADIEVSVPQKMPVNDAELCAVFANSLDNAIEACEKLPENQRKISVKSKTDKGLFVLQVQNHVIGETVFQNGIPTTTKQNAKAHGFGLAGIREIAEKHGGSMDISENEGMFTLLIYFYLNNYGD